MLGESALDKLRDALLALDKVHKEGISPDKLVDPCTRLRQHAKHLEDLNDLWSTEIKKHCVENKTETLEGNSFKAVVKVRLRECLITEKVRTFLGKRLPQYLKTQTITELNFNPRE